MWIHIPAGRRACGDWYFKSLALGTSRLPYAQGLSRIWVLAVAHPASMNFLR